jgi:hypothetical protein
MISVEHEVPKGLAIQAGYTLRMVARNENSLYPLMG